MGVEGGFDSSNELHGELADCFPGELCTWLEGVGKDSLDSSSVEDCVAQAYHAHHGGGEEEGGEGVRDGGPEVAQQGGQVRKIVPVVKSV